MAEKELYHCDLLNSNNKKCNKKYKTRQELERHIKHEHTQVQEINKVSGHESGRKSNMWKK